MVREQLQERGINDTAVLNAMNTVPRELFVSKPYQQYAYDDTPLPIPEKQTISQPYVIALMISALNLEPADRVLEIGSGSGYVAAVLSRIAQEVYAVERHKTLVNYAQQRLSHLGYDNVWLRHGDGTLGWEEYAPYTAILVSAGGPSIPPALKQQLTGGGRMVVPVGRRRRKQRLVRVVRESEDDYSQIDLGPVAFVPLIGDEGWDGKKGKA